MSSPFLLNSTGVNNKIHEIKKDICYGIEPDTTMSDILTYIKSKHKNLKDVIVVFDWDDTIVDRSRKNISFRNVNDNDADAHSDTFNNFCNQCRGTYVISRRSLLDYSIVNILEDIEALKINNILNNTDSIYETISTKDVSYMIYNSIAVVADGSKYYVLEDIIYRRYNRFVDNFTIYYIDNCNIEISNIIIQRRDYFLDNTDKYKKNFCLMFYPTCKLYTKDHISISEIFENNKIIKSKF